MMRNHNADALTNYSEHDDSNGEFIDPTGELDQDKQDGSEDVADEPVQVDTVGIQEFNQRVEHVLRDLDDLDVNSIFDQQNTDEATQQNDTIAEAVINITGRVDDAIETFTDTGHPALESLAHHKVIALQTTYAVLNRKLQTIVDGDDLLPPQTAQQLQDEIDGWRTALITVEDDIDHSVTVNIADIPRHKNNFNKSPAELLDQAFADKLTELDDQRTNLLERAASEDNSPVTLPTLRRVMDYGDTLIRSQDQLQDAVERIDADQDLDVDGLHQLETKLGVTARYLAGDDAVVRATAEANDTVDDLLSIVAAAQGENTERMKNRLKELSHALGDITAELVEVNHAKHPAT